MKGDEIFFDLVVSRNANYDMNYLDSRMVSLLDGVGTRLGKLGGGETQFASTIFQFAKKPNTPEFESLPRWICQFGRNATLRMLELLHSEGLLDTLQTGSDGLTVLEFSKRIKANQNAVKFLERVTAAQVEGFSPEEYMVPSILRKIEKLGPLPAPAP